VPGAVSAKQSPYYLQAKMLFNRVKVTVVVQQCQVVQQAIGGKLSNKYARQRFSGVSDFGFK
jgi:hypothetical protein